MGLITVREIEAGLWLWMAWACKKRHDWGRNIATLLMAAGVLSSLLSLRDDLSGWVRLSSALPPLIGIVAVVNLWKRESSRYFIGPSWFTS
jgi:hypothetical protein